MTAPAIARRYQLPDADKIPRNWGALREPRQGIMLHYDGGGSDDGAVEWMLFDRRCRVSYNWLVLDDGTVRDVAPIDKRAWHAGECRPSDPRFTYRDANSAFYGIALAANHKDKATRHQFDLVVQLCTALMRRHRWPAEETWRITSHRVESWPRDPSEGQYRKEDPDGRFGVVLDVATVRCAVASVLD